MNQNSFLLAAASLLSAQALYSTDIDVQRRLFQQFQIDFKRSYSDAEEPIRFAAFVENLKTIDARNAEDTATHGITQFSDLTQEEFASRYLTAKSSAESTSPLRNVVEHVENTYNGTSSLVDWSGIYTTPGNVDMILVYYISAALDDCVHVHSQGPRVLWILLGFLCYGTT